MKKAALIVTVLATSAATEAYADRGGRHGLDFSSVDADSNGAVTASELAQFHLARFEEADKDASGTLDTTETATLVGAGRAGENRQARRLSRFIDRFDENDDGLIDAAEFAGADRSEKIMNRLDADGDGQITLTEAEERIGKRKGKRDDNASSDAN